MSMCRYCHATEEHTSDCPVVRLQELDAQREIFECPCCDQTQVEVNANDFYECRVCGVQYCAGSYTRAAVIEETSLTQGEIVLPVLRLDKERTGVFRYDIASERLKALMRSMDKQ